MMYLGTTLVVNTAKLDTTLLKVERGSTNFEDIQTNFTLSELYGKLCQAAESELELPTVTSRALPKQLRVATGNQLAKLTTDYNSS